jgi:hypothetical protein
VSSSFSLNIKFPDPFSVSLGFLSVFSLDFLALECMHQNYLKANTYFITVYVWCIVPILLTLLIGICGLIRVSLSKVVHSAKETISAIIDQHVWLFLFLTYIVLPPVANKQLQSLDCITLNSGHKYLRADTSVDCRSQPYKEFASVVYLFIAVYQSVPILWMVLLYRKKYALNPPASRNDEKLAQFIRSCNPELSSIKFLFAEYKCSMWWFEILDMYRRIFFIGILPLVSRNSAVRASLGCILAIVCYVFFRENNPYRVDFTNSIAYVAQVFLNTLHLFFPYLSPPLFFPSSFRYCFSFLMFSIPLLLLLILFFFFSSFYIKFAILITYYFALTIETGSMINFGLEGYKLGVFLICSNLVVFVLVLTYAWKKYQKKLKAEQMKEYLVKYIYIYIYFSFFLRSMGLTHFLILFSDLLSNRKINTILFLSYVCIFLCLSGNSL